MKRLFDISTRELVPGGFFYLSLVILLCSFGLVILSQAVWDYDFWWHISTGRYIIETRSLPATDPFSFTSQMAENSNLYAAREKFILTQYWLAQVLMYLLYKNIGPVGIGLLRVGLLLGALYVIYRSLKSRGTVPYITYISCLLAGYGMVRFFGDRPVHFTICFSVVCFVMIDDYLRKRSRLFYLLPVLMLLWANLHGGFILGDAIILVFATTEGIKMLLGRSSFSEKEKITFFSLSLLAIAASCVNPNGLFAFQIAFSPEYAPFYNGIQEYQSPFRLYAMKYSPIEYAYVSALFIFPLVVLLRRRKFNPAHLVLLVFLAAESISAGRFTVYYCLIASLVLGNELSLWVKEHKEKFIIKESHLNIAFSVIMLASSVLFFAAKANSDVFSVKESAWSVPKRPADFISQNHIRGNMLNDMPTGGYLTWRLYPKLKTFIDTRGLNFTVMKEYSWIAQATESAYGRTPLPGKAPLWKKLIEHYKINLIVFSPFDLYGNVLPFVIKLIDDDDWVPVFSDVMAIVFVKNVPENKPIIDQFRQTKDEVYNMMIIRASLIAQTSSGNPLHMESLGDIFAKTGRTNDAIKAYEYALKRRPGDPGVKEKLDNLIKKKAEAKNE